MAIAFGAVAFLFPAGIKTKIPGIEDTGTSNTHEKRIVIFYWYIAMYAHPYTKARKPIASKTFFIL